MKRTPINIIIIGNGESELSASIVIQMEQKRYLFNVPEGIHRQFVEDKLRIGTIDKIFMTSNDWTCWGGYISLVVNYFSSHIPSIPVHCCTELNQLLLDADMVPIENRMYECMKKWTHDETCIQDDQFLFIPIVTETKQNKILQYHIQLPTFIGKFDNTKANQLQIPGKLRGKLIKGESIQLEDGRIITHSDVCSPSECPGMIGILHFPTIEHVDLYLKRIKELAIEKQSFCALVIISPFHIRSYQPLLSFISLYSKHSTNSTNETIPIFYLHDRIGSSSEETVSLLTKTSFTGSQEIQKLFSTFFPQYAPSSFHQTPSIPTTITKEIFTESMYSPSLVQYTIYPQFECLSLHKNELNESISSIPQLQFNHNETFQFNRSIQQKESLFQLLLIGTGGAIPSRTRNGSCEILKVHNKTIVIDCGECNAFQILNCGINPNDIDLLFNS